MTQKEVIAEVLKFPYQSRVYEGPGLAVSMEELEEENMLSAWNPSGQVGQLLNLDDSEEEIEVDIYDSGAESGSDEERDNADKEVEGRIL